MDDILVLASLAIVMVTLEAAIPQPEFVSIVSTTLLAITVNFVERDFMVMLPKEDLIHACHVLVRMLLIRTILQQVVRLMLSIILTIAIILFKKFQ